MRPATFRSSQIKTNAPTATRLINNPMCTSAASVYASQGQMYRDRNSATCGSSLTYGVRAAKDPKSEPQHAGGTSRNYLSESTLGHVTEDCEISHKGSRLYRGSARF